MPSTTAPPIFSSVIRAWVDAFRAVVAMPAVAAIGFALLIAIGLATDLLPPLFRSGEAETLGQSLIWSSAAAMAESFLLAPLAIAIHRHVLLGEVASGYALQLADHRFFRFFYFSFVLALAQALLFFAAILLFPETFNAPVGSPDSSGIGSAVTAVIIVGVLAVTARVIVLFPAVAVDAPAASWGHAWRATSGRFWIIVFIFFLAGVPLLLGWLLLSVLLDLGENGRFSQTALMLQEMPSLCVYAAAASRLYQAFGGPLGGAAGSRDASVV